MRRIFDQLGDKVRIGSNKIELITNLPLHMAVSVTAVIARLLAFAGVGIGGIGADTEPCERHDLVLVKRRVCQHLGSESRKNGVDQEQDQHRADEFPFGTHAFSLASSQYELQKR